MRMENEGGIEWFYGNSPAAPGFPIRPAPMMVNYLPKQQNLGLPKTATRSGNLSQ